LRKRELKEIIEGSLVLTLHDLLDGICDTNGPLDLIDSQDSLGRRIEEPFVSCKSIFWVCF
jgi:hypothetical protein